MGVVTAVALYRVGRVLTGSSTLAAAGVALALADPAYHTFANLFFYEFMLYALLVLLVATAVRYPEHGETPGYSWWPSARDDLVDAHALPPRLGGRFAQVASPESAHAWFAWNQLMQAFGRTPRMETA
jgi:hypothetical protein